MSYERTLRKYASVLPGLELADFENASAILRLTQAELNDFANVHTVHPELPANGQRYQMLVNRPSEWDETSAVVITGEFANGIRPTHTARALIIRNMVNPRAALVIQPNPELGQLDAINLSKAERAEVRRGSVGPLLGRLVHTLESIGNPTELTFSGLSQGTALALGCGAHPDMPKSAIAILEAPHLEARTSTELTGSFMSCGKQLEAIVLENYDTPEEAAEAMRNFSLRGLARYAIGALSRDNLAMLGLLRSGIAGEQILRTLENGGSVVHGYGTVDTVSPLNANRAIKRRFDGDPRYQAFEFTGADHSITNNYLVSGDLARTARTLLVQKR